MAKLKKERMITTMDFPLLDQHLSAGRLIGLFIFPSILFLLILTINHHAHLESQFLYFIVISLLPLVVFLLLFQLISKDSFKALFKKITKQDLKTGIVFLVIYFIYEMITQFFLKKASTANASAKTIANADHKWLTIIREAAINLFDLMNEELFGVITFLALLALLYQVLHLSQKISLLVALVISSILFGFLHYQAYDWHISQMLISIGFSRLFFTGAYIKTKNIWISFLIHYIWDTGIFTMVSIVSVVLSS